MWTIPADKTKMRRAHAIPLSHQALDIISGIETDASFSTYLFPSLRSTHRPMSENTVNAALRRLGYAKEEMTGHGFRAMAATLLNEMGIWNSDAIERQLAHADNNSVRRLHPRRILGRARPHDAALVGLPRQAPRWRDHFTPELWE